MDLRVLRLLLLLSVLIGVIARGRRSKRHGRRSSGMSGMAGAGAGNQRGGQSGFAGMPDPRGGGFPGMPGRPGTPPGMGGGDGMDWMSQKGKGRGKGGAFDGKGGMPGMPGMQPIHGSRPIPDGPLKFAFAKELDVDSFAKSVEKVANIADDDSYYPLVLYYNSTVHNSRSVLWEFEQAAELIANASSNKSNGDARSPKFFMLRCDESAGAQAKCDKHVGDKEAATLPFMKLYRDMRTFFYRGPHWAHVVAGWAHRVSRHALLKLEQKKDLAQFDEDKVLFLITSDAMLEHLTTWTDLAFEHLEESYFGVAPLGSEVAALMLTAPNVTVRGKGIDALPFTGRMNRDSLRQWVSVNRWPVVVKLTPTVAFELLRSGRPVVIFVQKLTRKNRLSAAADQELFAAKAKEIRRNSSGKYLFATIDTATKENGAFMSRIFSIVSAPSIFVCSWELDGSSDSGIIYWERASLKSAETLDENTIEELRSSYWATEDNATSVRIKRAGKYVYRFVTGSVLVAVLVSLVTVLCCGTLCLIWYEDTDSTHVPARSSVKAKKHD